MLVYLFHGQEACAKTYLAQSLADAILYLYARLPGGEYERAEIRDSKGNLIALYSAPGIDF